MKLVGVELPNNGGFAARITPSHIFHKERNNIMFTSNEVGVETPAAQAWVDSQRDTWRNYPSKVIPIGLPSNVTQVGSDPELFVVSAKTGKVIPAFKFLPKTADARKDHNGIQLFWDGFQAEFATLPNMCLAYLVDSFYQGLQRLHCETKAHDKDAILSPSCLIELDPNEINDAADEHVALGCSPSVNIYNIPPIMVGNPRELTRRVAGCHVHLEFNHTDQDRMLRGVQLTDKTVLLMSMSMLEGLEDTSRREYYGRPGEVRFPMPNRIEYRAFPSTVQIHPALVHFHFDMTRLMFELTPTTVLEDLWIGETDEMIDVVMSGDVRRARQILERNENTVKYVIKRKYWHDGAVENTWAMIMNGVRHNKLLSTMEQNWGLLDGSWLSHSEKKNTNFTTFALAQA